MSWSWCATLWTVTRWQAEGSWHPVVYLTCSMLQTKKDYINLHLRIKTNDKFSINLRINIFNMQIIFIFYSPSQKPMGNYSWPGWCNNWVVNNEFCIVSNNGTCAHQRKRREGIKYAPTTNNGQEKKEKSKSTLITFN